MSVIFGKTEKMCIAVVAVGFLLFASVGFQKDIRIKNFQKSDYVFSHDEETENETNSEEAPTTASTANTTYVVKTEPSSEQLHININTATAEEFQKLYGIGEKLANSILSYREANGYFNNIEEIKKVDGIGEKIFERIRDCIYVESPYYPEEIAPTEEHTERPTEETETTEPEKRLEDYVPIDLNTADAETLMLLPYVDEEIAERIISIREQIHGYSHVYELLIVEELKQEQVAEIIEYVYVSKNEGE